MLFSALCLLLSALPSQAAVNNVTVSNTTIPFETVGLPTGTTITFQIDAGGAVQIDIHKLENISDPPSTANQVAGISQSGLALGTYGFFWDALWLLGGDLGRQNGSYQIIVTQGSSSFVFSSLVQITSVDIHNLSVTPSFGANNSPAFPFIIQYALAKDSIATVRVNDSQGATVRTLVNNAPQLGEALATNSIPWDGLNDAGRPVALGVYTILVDARDPNSADVAIPRSRTVAVQSLANLNTNLEQLFADNAFVYPNPVRGGQDATFQALAVRNNATISVKIYTLAGDLVRTESFHNLPTASTATFTWNGTNEAGKKVGRGLYYFVVRQEDPEGTLQTTKKVAVIP